MTTYRVFVQRHYIAVEFFEVKAKSPGRARSLAERAAKKLRPDPRLKATDNGWIADDPIKIKRPGAYPDGWTHPVKKISPHVFQFKRKKPCHGKTS
jgi:hypothetical protein